jgi:4-hydroxybenzoate polyprenyltransferase
VIARVRLLIVLCRPPVLLLLVTYVATGLATIGHEQDPLPLAGCSAAVAGFLLFSVALNDFSDAAIDRVNLPGDPRRPLADGAAAGRDMAVVAVTGAVVALGASAALGWRVAVVTAAGLLVSAGYSLRPVRLADRGAVAALVLPACYVAVPFLVAVESLSPVPSASDWLLLGGLYVGFIGRILLKDFRDVRGDALFGKRTFLVRHGRRRTCAFSAGCWSAGGIVLAVAAGRPAPGCIGGTLLLLTAALVLLRALADERGARRDESLVAAIAVVGRGMLLLLLAQLSMTHAHWAPLGQAAVCGVLVVVVLGQAATMVRRGPISRYTVPVAWSDAAQERPPHTAPLES